jgi:2-C-methyl-D-erythritol 4-phosphate cytidylyltransferase
VGATGQAAAIIVGAGSGERLGAQGPKAFLELAGRPLVAWSVEAFSRTESVEEAVIVAPPARVEEMAEAAGDGLPAAGEGSESSQGSPLKFAVVPGGETRSASVAGGLAAIADRAKVVVIHDAARPLVTPTLIDDLVAQLAARLDAAGVIAATPLTDTVKRAREPRPTRGDVVQGEPIVAETVSRAHLWAAQTPQVFRARDLRAALAGETGRAAAATDEAMLVEQAGGTILIHASGSENLKVTTPLDLRLAELLLAERGDSSLKP